MQLSKLSLKHSLTEAKVKALQNGIDILKEKGMKSTLK